jgi:hypothetical protein
MLIAQDLVQECINDRMRAVQEHFPLRIFLEQEQHWHDVLLFHGGEEMAASYNDSMECLQYPCDI